MQRELHRSPAEAVGGCSQDAFAAGDVAPDDDWDEPWSAAIGHAVWDAFEREDEAGEPQPEYGDFWGCPDEDDLAV